jgi:predicted RND superfamily exporter protein
LRIGLALALLGAVAGTQTDLTSDPRRLLPADSLESRDLASIERETGTPGDVNVIVRSDRLLDPEVVGWMSAYQRKVLRQNGFRQGRPCGEADLCPALSLTNLFGDGRQSARQIREAVAALPRYFSQNVITPDRRTANIAFRMGSMSPAQRRDVVDGLRAELNPPAGVEAELAGPVVAAADGEDDLARSMWLVALAALLVVAALMAAASRSLEAGLVVAIPLALAVGWTFLVLFLLPIDMDFLTAAMGAIVVAVCAGPAVLAARHYRAARAGGLAAEAATGRIRDRAAGPAVAYGAVVVAGFLALTVVDIPALRDLGAAGAVTLPLTGLGLAVALPATLVWADLRGGLRVPRSPSELAAAGRSLAVSVGAAVRAGGRGIRRAALAVRRGVPRARRKVRAVVTSRR